MILAPRATKSEIGDISYENYSYCKLLPWYKILDFFTTVSNKVITNQYISHS